MSADALDALPDAQLSEAFAVEVAGWRKCVAGPWIGWMEPVGKPPMFQPPDLPPFATSADAVLPYVQDGPGWAEFNKHAIENGLPTGKSRWRVRFKPLGFSGFIEGTATTFARAACIALLRAKRAEKGLTSQDLIESIA